MRLGKKQELFTRALALLLQFAAFRGFEIRMGDVSRSKEEAKRLGFEGSLHCSRLAADLNLFNSEGDYLTKTEDHQELGAFWESLSGEYDNGRGAVYPVTFRWGGRFSNPDGNHYSIEHEGRA